MNNFSTAFTLMAISNALDTFSGIIRYYPNQTKEKTAAIASSVLTGCAYVLSSCASDQIIQVSNITWLKSYPIRSLIFFGSLVPLLYSLATLKGKSFKQIKEKGQRFSLVITFKNSVLFLSGCHKGRHLGVLNEVKPYANFALTAQSLRFLGLFI